MFKSLCPVYFFALTFGGVLACLLWHIFSPLSTFFSKFAKVFRFGNSCALCARLPRQLRAGVSYARMYVLRAYYSCAIFRRWGLPPFWVGFSACFGGILWGLFWGGVVGERERQRRTGKGERAQGRTANTANGASTNGRTACPFSSVRQSYLFSVDNICRMVGGILQPNGNRKTANSMCPLTLTPTPIFPNTEYIRSVGGFGNLPNGGGEFRNRNHGFLLRSIQTIDKFSRTVGNFIEDLLILSNRAYFTWFRTALILVPAATIVTEVFLYNI